MLLAVRVRMLVPLVGLGENDAVTPLGRDGMARLTFPVNPFWSFTVTVAVPEPPRLIVIDDNEVLSVKFAGFTVKSSVVDAVDAPDVPVMVTD